MKLRSVSIVVVLLALAVFALLNWTAFNTPTTLSLGFTQVQAPLGLIMLVVTGAVCVLFLFFIVFQQAGVIMETRRTNKELTAQRELADKAEASRLVDLRIFLDGEMQKLQAQSNAATRELNARLTQVENALTEKLAETARTLAAYVGEVDDKLDRMNPLPPSPPALPMR